MNLKDINFKKADITHVDIIFKWLAEPHMVEFWDNTQEHKDDILNFIHGRKQAYFAGTTKYWLSYIQDEPYAFILSDVISPDEEGLPDLYKRNLSKNGITIALDFGIGNKKFLGQGLAVPTLGAFMQFYRESIDKSADTFLIDPDENNPRAKHVYEKAGFKTVGEYDVTQGAFKGNMSYLMVKKA